MMINGVLINKNHFYRIKNDFDKSDNSFWYYFSSNEKELNSWLTTEKAATVYSGEVIIKNVDIIRQYKNAKLIEV